MWASRYILLVLIAVPFSTKVFAEESKGPKQKLEGLSLEKKNSECLKEIKTRLTKNIDDVLYCKVIGQLKGRKSESGSLLFESSCMH